MNKPLISVIIAIYNAEKWISRMIDSVLNQSLKDFELLLVDDGSNDGTADILDDYAQKDDRITLLHNNHGGVCSARQAGLNVANGEYFIQLDADDWIEQNMLEEMYSRAKEKNADIVLCAFENIYTKNGHIIHHVYQNCPSSFSKNTLYKDILIGRCNFANWNKLIKLSIVIDNNLSYPIEITQIEDAVFSLRVAKVAKVIAHTPMALYHYDQSINPLSMTNANNQKLINSRLHTIDYCLKYTDLRPLAYKCAIGLCMYHSLRFNILSKKEFKERFSKYKFKGFFIKTPKISKQAYLFAFTAMYLSFDLASFVMKLKLKRLERII